MIYVGRSLPAASGMRARDPALIDPRLIIDARAPAHDGEGMTYWPSYEDSSARCRAAYLAWLADGRRTPGTYIGYVFLFYYGLERRVLVDGKDLELVRGEVRRLLDLYGSNNSFRGYANNLLAMSVVANLQDRDEAFVRENFLWGESDVPANLAAALAWYHLNDRALPADVAAAAAAEHDDAKRSVVATRSRTELLDLFAVRYRERFPDGLKTHAAVRPLRLEYHAASAGLLGVSGKLGATLPHVMGRAAQFKPLVAIWNDCIDDLKRFATARKKAEGEGDGEGALTPEQWEALPPELRSSYDHPDQEKWDSAVSSAARCGDSALMTLADLAPLTRLDAREKFTAAQLRKIADTATYVGYALEPDPRISAVGGAPDTQVVLWRARAATAPKADVWGPASIVLRLAMQVVMADGAAHEEELAKVTEMVEALFVFDEATRERLHALRSLLLVSPAKTTGLTKKLVETHKKEQLEAIGRLLVAVSAVDGVLTPGEHKALKALYKGLGLSSAELDGALASVGLTLDSDQPVVVAEGKPARAGSAVTAPPGTSPAARLDPKAIEAILRDTREVASLLATVFEAPDAGEPASDAPVPARVAVATPTSSVAPDPLPTDEEQTTDAVAASFFAGLDGQYARLVRELIQRDSWAEQEIRVVVARHRLMPSAALEAINSWSDASLGDYLIIDEGAWTIRRDLIRS